MKRITVIDNYDSFVYNLVRYIEELNCEVVVQRNDQLNFAEIDTTDAIVLSPGPGIPSEAGQLMEVISRYSESKKILGVCLGHQALAEHFKGRISPSLKAIHGKESAIKVDQTSLLFEGLPNEISVGRYHSWSVDTLPGQFRLTGQTDTGENMAMEHSNLPIYGVQFHPESILTPDGRRIISNWININL